MVNLAGGDPPSEIDEQDDGDDNEASIWGRVYKNVKNFVLHDDDQGESEFTTKPAGVTPSNPPPEAGNNATEKFFADARQVKSPQHGSVVGPVSVVKTSLGLGNSTSLLHKSVANTNSTSVLSSSKNGTSLHAGSQGDKQLRPPLQIVKLEQGHVEGQRVEGSPLKQPQDAKKHTLVRQPPDVYYHQHIF